MVYKASSSCPCPQSPLVPLPEGNQDDQILCIPWEILSAHRNKQFTQSNLLKPKLAIPFPAKNLPFTNSWVSRTFLHPADLSVPNDRFSAELNPASGLFLTCSLRMDSFPPGLCLLVPSSSITSLESTHSLPKPVIHHDRRPFVCRLQASTTSKVVSLYLPGSWPVYRPSPTLDFSPGG